MNNGIGKTFIEGTKHVHLAQSDQMRGLPQPPLQRPVDQTRTAIDLPDPLTCFTRGLDVREAIQERRSIRQYAQSELTLAELSYLLWCTQGVQQVRDHIATFRTVPSAGARHAFETTLLINRVTDLAPGLYHFVALEHTLVQMNAEPSIADQITAGCLGQQFVKTAAATFIWSAVPYRMNWRYGERGFRYLHLDAGHVCQNLYLSAASIDCGVCAIAAFDDDRMNQLLEIDGESEFAIYVATVGKKRASK